MIPSMRSLALLLLLCACTRAVPDEEPLVVGPGEAGLDGLPFEVPLLTAIASIGAENSEGERVWTVHASDALDCARQRLRDGSVDAAQEQFLVDGDFEALQQAIASADAVLYPAGSWVFRLDLGPRSSFDESPSVPEVVLFGERRVELESEGDDDDSAGEVPIQLGADVEVTAEFPGITEFVGTEAGARGTFHFQAAWTGEEEGWYEFDFVFDAAVCD